MEPTTQIIYIHPAAPPKPAWGAACNGCGLCCLAEPCPLGMLLSRKRIGACDALRWNDTQSRYECGAITDSTRVLQRALPSVAQSAIPLLSKLLATTAHRWIAAGEGCDATIEPTP